MGRGRAKAKQQKVARDLKYNTHHTDLTALQIELGSSAGDYSPTTAVEDDADSDDIDDRWSAGR